MKACQVYEKLKNEAEKMRQACLDLPSPLHHIIRRRVVCYKEMYKIAKENKASPMFLIHQVLKQGITDLIFPNFSALRYISIMLG